LEFTNNIIAADFNSIIGIKYLIDAVYGFNSSSISEQVQYVQQCLHTTKVKTMWMAAHVANFPVTSEQKRYWKVNMCRIKENLGSRKIVAQVFHEVKQKKKK